MNFTSKSKWRIEMSKRKGLKTLRKLCAAPLCRWHGCRMVGHEERVPFAGSTAGPGRGRHTRIGKRATRISYHCPRKDCHWVACGEAEYSPTYARLRAERLGHRYLSSL